MFIAQIQVPSIGMHKWTNFHTTTYAIDAATETEALEAVHSVLGQKDAEVQKALYDQNDYKEGEYFEVSIHEVPPDRKIIFVHEPSTGFHKPSKTLRL